MFGRTIFALGRNVIVYAMLMFVLGQWTITQSEKTENNKHNTHTAHVLVCMDMSGVHLTILAFT